jgi:hypothetical protein
MVLDDSLSSLRSLAGDTTTPSFLIWHTSQSPPFSSVANYPRNYQNDRKSTTRLTGNSSSSPYYVMTFSGGTPSLSHANALARS